MDINPGQFPNPPGSPVQPGTAFAGPLLAGTVVDSDGTNNLAGLGGTTGKSNQGYAVMAQCAQVTQADGSSSIVIPAQSKILRIGFDTTTVFTGAAATFAVGTTDGTTNTAALTANTATGAAVGKVALAPTTAAQLANWDNTSNAVFQVPPISPHDINVRIFPTNTGSGVGILTVEYIPGVNMAS